jgi:hypothetical protein
MSGANITGNTIPASAIVGGGGSNTFSNGISISGFYTSTTNALVVTGNTNISGNIVIGNGLVVSNGTVIFPSGSISTSAVASGFVDVLNAQSIAGVKTFSSAPVFSGGANVSAGGLTVTGGITATAAQTITFGTNAPTMSGANISSGSIPTSAVASGFVDTTNAQSSIGGAKTFTGGVTVSTNALTLTGGITATGAQTITFGTNAPTMYGTNITNIPSSAIIGGVGGGNSFTTGINISGFYTSTTSALNVTGNANINGNVTAVSYNATSDRRLKSNIQPLYSQWDKLRNIEPVTFDWKVDGRPDIGFIAQDIYNSYPQLRPNYRPIGDLSFNDEEPVDASGNPIYYTIDYGRMTPFLWQGMKEIMQKIDRLETENKQLIERISKLESQ